MLNYIERIYEMSQMTDSENQVTKGLILTLL